ncbi:AraC family transcriptional regulator [Colwellia sp. D2M02]|uniref:AraC family transcriptional regulator n=1 Tax=Colwellia asteriadis TaxID=517723 RepID=A0ABP3WJM5_9GAMM|nr:helix-turn-helix domain-containing protein [Colwellia sp. D2M02]MBU2892696.1 AraC family transcriptional regulator [Colwellia sp. D2M02]
MLLSHTIDNIRKSPQVLVENKLSFAGPDSELAIYDTYEVANKVKLSSDQLLFCAMVTGKKIMHSDEDYAREFLPHQSFIMAPYYDVEIDFPEASLNKPTTCLAIELSRDRVNQIANSLNVEQPLNREFGCWQYHHKLLHTHHNNYIQQVLNRIVRMYSENHPDRNVMIELAVSELTIRLLRQQTRDFILTFTAQDPENSGLTAALNFIHHQLSQPINVDELARIACMSRTKFFSQFKQHLGCSPLVYQQQIRLKKAAESLAQGQQITQTCFALGFVNSSHFSRCFKALYGISPREYKSRHTTMQTPQSADNHQ